MQAGHGHGKDHDAAAGRGYLQRHSRSAHPGDVEQRFAFQVGEPELLEGSQRMFLRRYGHGLLFIKGNQVQSPGTDIALRGETQKAQICPARGQFREDGVLFALVGPQFGQPAFLPAGDPFTRCNARYVGHGQGPRSSPVGWN